MSDGEGSAPPRVRNRWGEGARLRDEILGGASRLLSELGGSDGLTIRGVAREVGVAAPSIYRHFADRTALIQGLLEHEFARLLGLMRAADERVEPTDVVGRVRSQMHAYCDFAVANPGHYRLMLGAGPHRPRAGERIGPLVKVIDALAVGFGHCERAGHPLRVDTERAALLVFVGVHGRVALLHSNYSPENARKAKAFVDELISLVFA